MFLPNLTASARAVDPNVSLQTVINSALSLAGGSLPGLDPVDLAGSDFVDDLFEPNYWMQLHGKLSEPAGQYLVFDVKGRVPVAAGVDLPGLAREVALTPAQRQALADDLAAD